MFTNLNAFFSFINKDFEKNIVSTGSNSVYYFFNVSIKLRFFCIQQKIVQLKSKNESEEELENEEHEIAQIARLLEEKHVNNFYKNNFKIIIQGNYGKSKKDKTKINFDDVMNKGIGYDVNDAFIDDTEAVIFFFKNFNFKFN